MLAISTRAYTALGRTSLEGGLLAHVQDHFPVHWRVLGPEQVRSLIEVLQKRAAAQCAVRERDLYLYIGVALWLGTSFDQDPQLPWTRPLLADREDPKRFERLSDLALQYLDRACGADNALLKDACTRLRALLANPRLAQSQAADVPLGDLLYRLYPEKVNVMGQAAFEALLQAGQATALARAQGSVVAPIYITCLMLLLGSGVVGDPAFPWVGDALRHADRPVDERVMALRTDGGLQLGRWLEGA